jgi:hypothetical protein
MKEGKKGRGQVLAHETGINQLLFIEEVNIFLYTQRRN